MCERETEKVSVCVCVRVSVPVLQSKLLAKPTCDCDSATEMGIATGGSFDDSFSQPKNGSWPNKGRYSFAIMKTLCQVDKPDGRVFPHTHTRPSFYTIPLTALSNI